MNAVLVMKKKNNSYCVSDWSGYELVCFSFETSEEKAKEKAEIFMDGYNEGYNEGYNKGVDDAQ